MAEQGREDPLESPYTYFHLQLYIQHKYMYVYVLYNMSITYTYMYNNKIGTMQILYYKEGGLICTNTHGWKFVSVLVLVEGGGSGLHIRIVIKGECCNSLLYFCNAIRQIM